MTQLTELHVMVPFAHEQGDLRSLTRLQRLALDYSPYRWGVPDFDFEDHPFVLWEVAGITKLRLSMRAEVGSSPLASIGRSRCLLSLTNILQFCKTLSAAGAKFK